MTVLSEFESGHGGGNDPGSLKIEGFNIFRPNTII
jgi:hypothetical protein